VNRARKENHRLVAEEDELKNEGPNAEGKRARRRYAEEREKEKAQMTDNGIDPEKEKLMNVTASEAQWKQKQQGKREELKGKSFGWEQYNTEAHYNAYDRRLKEIPVDLKAYEKQKEELNEDDFYKDAHHLSYGQAQEPEVDKVNGMVEELNKTIEKRKKYSRRRAHYDEAYVDYINKRNKVFNDKIERAFGPYTAEVKQNLERGTAI